MDIGLISHNYPPDKPDTFSIYELTKTVGLPSFDSSYVRLWSMASISLKVSRSLENFEQFSALSSYCNLSLANENTILKSSCSDLLPINHGAVAPCQMICCLMVINCCKSWTPVLRSANCFTHFHTTARDMHVSLFTSFNHWWISVFVCPIAYKNRISYTNKDRITCQGL